MKRVAQLVAREAAAYLRSGLLAQPLGRSISENAEKESDFGVVFVPGVGATPSQLLPIKAALVEGANVAWFDAFDYSSLAHPAEIGDRLRRKLEQLGDRCARILAIGHSLGGFLLRLALQSERAPKAVRGFVSICAPLHGTRRSKLAPHPHLWRLAPDTSFMSEVIASAHRLKPLAGSMLMIGARLDQFISPFDSAFIDGEERLCLEATGHVGALFDREVHEAIVRLAKRVRDSASEPR